jgi:hypothetical protein
LGVEESPSHGADKYRYMKPPKWLMCPKHSGYIIHIFSVLAAYGKIKGLIDELYLKATAF